MSYIYSSDDLYIDPVSRNVYVDESPYYIVDPSYQYVSCCQKSLNDKVEEAIKKLDELSKTVKTMDERVTKLRAHHNATNPTNQIAYSASAQTTGVDKAIADAATAFHGVLDALNGATKAAEINKQAAIRYMKSSNGQGLDEARRHVQEAARLLG